MTRKEQPEPSLLVRRKELFSEISKKFKAIKRKSEVMELNSQVSSKTMSRVFVSKL
jgi:hypothetical protein